MPLAQFSHTVDDLIAGVIVQPFRHSKIVLPGGQRLLAAAIKILFLPFQIVFDLHQAHSVCDKHQILGADPFFFAPAQHIIRDTLSGPLLKLQPCQVFRIAIHPGLTGVQHQFPHVVAVMETLLCQPLQSSLPDLLHLGKPFPDCQVFFRISNRMASYPLGQAGLTKFFFLQAGQSLSIYPAGLITVISVIAGAS